MRLVGVSVLLGTTISGALAAPQAVTHLTLSQCIQTVAADLIQSAGCTFLDIKCMCQQASFLQTLESTVRGSCGEADASVAVSFGVEECAAVGITLTTSSSSDLVSSTATSTATLLGASSTTTSSGTTSVTMTMPTSTALSTAPTFTSSSSNTTWNSTIIPPSPFTGAADGLKIGWSEAPGLEVAALLGVALVMALL